MLKKRSFCKILSIAFCLALSNGILAAEKTTDTPIITTQFQSVYLERNTRAGDWTEVFMLKDGTKVTHYPDRMTFHGGTGVLSLVGTVWDEYRFPVATNKVLSFSMPYKEGSKEAKEFLKYLDPETRKLYQPQVSRDPIVLKTNSTRQEFVEALIKAELY